VPLLTPNLSDFRIMSDLVDVQRALIAPPR
jgi:hypothetical protein